MTALVRCRVCGTSFAASLLEVTDVETGALSYVCKPGSAGSDCWLTVGDREHETIAELVPATPDDRAAFLSAFTSRQKDWTR